MAGREPRGGGTGRNSEDERGEVKAELSPKGVITVSEGVFRECNSKVPEPALFGLSTRLMSNPSRLLKLNTDGTLQFADKFPSVYPPYAILSHTWGADEHELIFADIRDGTGKDKPGYAKILCCGQQARRDNLDYFWVDTCCIDKTSSSELTEAINSMFKWYGGAEKCYVYLADVSVATANGNPASEDTWHARFESSRWHTRGWTLQELLALASVDFYSDSWSYLGNKNTLCEQLQEATGLPASALRGEQLSNFGTEVRIRWAEGRNTKKPEDKWYSLLGIFGVHMPLIYGEGENADTRLRDGITKANKHASHHPQSCYPDGTGKDRRKALFDRLGFAQMESRKSTIKRPLEATCRWILRHCDYLAWLDPHQAQQHHGFLWIKGKPGAGKSTLMKFAHANAESTRVDDEVLVSFYFNARGDELEKSTIGLYRSVLFQLLAEAEDLRFVLDGLRCPKSHQSQGHVWTLEDLQRLNSAAIAQLGDRHLKCFIDALDEADEEQVREMIYFLEQLGENALEDGKQVRFCLASRHYPGIDIRHGRQLTLENENDHGEDLQRYVHRHLRAGRGKMVEEVRAQILEKANGIFMWVVLVVQILNKEFMSGRIFAVKERLFKIPAKLSDLFRDMVMRDQANSDELLLCLQWILFAVRPLRPEEYYFAMVSGLQTSPEDIGDWDPRIVTVDDMGLYVLNSSKGLAEISTSRVQFIHESVRDFLIKDGGLCELWPALGDSVHGLSHDRLKSCCQAYRGVDTSFAGLERPRHGLPGSSPYGGHERLPFHAYASQGLLYHANEAARTIPQHAFLDNLALGPLPRLTDVLNLGEALGYYQLGCDTALREAQALTRPRLLYILAEYGYTHLIVAARQSGYSIDQHCGRYQLPFFAAFANGHLEAVRALLQCDGSPCSVNVKFEHERNVELTLLENDTPLYWALREGNESVAEAAIELEDNSLDIKDDAGRNWVSLAAERGYARVVETLLALKFDMMSSDESGCTPLMYAFREEHEEVMRVLLQCGVDANAPGSKYGSELLAAGLQGNESMVRVLLECGVDANAPGGRHGSILQAICLQGNESIVRLLLQHGAEVNARGGDFGNALQAASQAGYGSTVRLLLESGADVNAYGGRHSTALLAASAIGDATIVELLLQGGADATASPGNGSNALYLASWHGYVNVVRQLIQHGVDVNAEGGFYGNALVAAAVGRLDEVVWLLLEHGAIVKEPGVKYNGALRATYTSVYYRGYAERRAAMVRLRLLQTAANSGRYRSVPTFA
ncbi:hypothetical protein LTR85_003915 [Meristemomyces frigidus]|nr:hypothetical protein LTR85_003915 [Meristemomyces frigidus]